MEHFQVDVLETLALQSREACRQVFACMQHLLAGRSAVVIQAVACIVAELMRPLLQLVIATCRHSVKEALSLHRAGCGAPLRILDEERPRLRVLSRAPLNLGGDVAHGRNVQTVQLRTQHS